MTWKHIFWNGEFIVSNKDDWEESLAGKVFASVQFEVFCAMDNWKKWPRFYYGRAWDFRLKDIFLQILEIVKTKQNDLNANDEEAACRIIEGTARSMGIEVS